MSILPLVFPDGTRAELAYPDELGLSGLGVTPNTLGYLDGACGFDFVFARGHGSLRGALYEGEEPFSVRESPSGTVVEVWPGGAEGAASYYLVFRFGEWEGVLPCSRGDLAATVDSARQWAGLLMGTVDADGFLVLGARPPLELATAGDHPHGPELIFGGAGDALVILSPQAECRSRGVEREGGWARFCLRSDRGAIITTVQSEDEAFISALIRELRLRTIQLGR